MEIPDYISPIVAHRVWYWDDEGLKSPINGEPWLPNQPASAGCLRYPTRWRHRVPANDCTCGVYAWKSIDKGRIKDDALHGEVYLWGKIWEHEIGYRAQYAYPKSLVIPPGTVHWPLGKIEWMAEAEKRLQPLVAYKVDIYLRMRSELDSDKVLLWTLKRGWCWERDSFYKNDPVPSSASNRLLRPPVNWRHDIYFTVTCPRCGAVYHSEEQHIGKHLRCTRCEAVVPICPPS